MDETQPGVIKDVVISVLKQLANSCKFIITESGYNGDRILLIKNGKPEVYFFPEKVCQRMLAKIAAKYNFETAYFYHPELVTYRNKH